MSCDPQLILRFALQLLLVLLQSQEAKDRSLAVPAFGCDLERHLRGVGCGIFLSRVRKGELSGLLV